MTTSTKVLNNSTTTQDILLKAYSAYYPYNIDFYSKQDESINTLMKISNNGYGNLLINNEFHADNCLLILRPLSDILIHMELIIPLIEEHSKNLEIEVEQISDMFPAILSNYNIANKLFELHYDLFNLIEKGLAIDINTLNS